MEFRYLQAHEMECRVGTCNDNGVSLLLYKDARCDARVLDETVGAESWQCRYYEQKGSLFCSVGIQIAFQDGPQWVWKDDCGTPSNMEAEKGEASDAFKRACFKWGLGRELYTAPFIWIPKEKCNIQTGRNGKPTCYDKFRVHKVKVEAGEIVGLAIANDTKGCMAYTWVKEGHEKHEGD